MNEKAGDSYFIDDIFYGKKSSAMVEFSRLRVEIALNMIGSETLETVRSLKVLDVGCGDGEFSVMILNMGHEVHGIDSKPDLVACARRKGIKAKVADVRKGLPYEDENFDLVYAAEILEHIYDTEFFLKEVYRVLKKDGAVILTVPNIACLPNRIRMIFWSIPEIYRPSEKALGCR